MHNHEYIYHHRDVLGNLILQHDLKYCSVCDKVYCVKCGKEWGNYCSSPNCWTWTAPTGQSTTLYSDLTSGGTVIKSGDIDSTPTK